LILPITGDAAFADDATAVVLWVSSMREQANPTVIASEAKQSIAPLAETWIASSLRSSQ
jgi:hypothetical protein